MSRARTLRSAWLGVVSYERAAGLQEGYHRRRCEGETGDVLLLLEHPHVYTIGRRGTRGDVLWDVATLSERGVEVCETDRGGMVTYHGPGQLVGYPIVHLGAGADLVRYLRDLEEVLIAALGDMGVPASRLPGCTGVWCGLDKIAALGVRVTRGVTKHGFALNLSCDLSYFGGIVPCGILDKGVTSVAAQRGDAPATGEAAAIVERRFAEVFGCRLAPLEEALL